MLLGWKVVYSWCGASTTTGGHRWYCATTQALQLTTTGLVAAGTIFNYQPTHTSINAAQTLTMAQLLSNLIKTTGTAPYTLAVPTGRNVHKDTPGGPTSGVSLSQSFDWWIIKSGTSTSAITILANSSGNSCVGNTVVAISTSAMFRTRVSQQNTAVTYRLS